MTTWLPGFARFDRAPAVDRLLAEGRQRRPQPLTPAERRSETILGVAFLAAATALAALGGHHGPPAGPAIALTAAYVLVVSIRFEVGMGWTVPSQLLLVPMLLLLGPAWVPLLVAGAIAGSRAVDIARRRIHPDRLLLALPDAWYVVGPAAVLAAAGATHPDWSDWPFYLAALAAQIAVDLCASTAREWLATGVSPRLQASVLVPVYAIDVLLAPIGLLAAFAAAGDPYRALLVLPLVALLWIFARERETHVARMLELSRAYRATGLMLSSVLEDKDEYTADHSHDVVSLSVEVADRLGLDEAARRRVEFGALLHDTGKLAVPAHIIRKPAALDPDEWAVMRMHTIEGQRMLDRVGGLLAEVGRVVRSSHERWDGGGYPDGLAGPAIPIESRIVSCCDAFNAMTTTRPYRAALSLETAVEELRRNAGTQFDPAVVRALLDVLGASGSRPLEPPSAALPEPV